MKRYYDPEIFHQMLDGIDLADNASVPRHAELRRRYKRGNAWSNLLVAHRSAAA